MSQVTPPNQQPTNFRWVVFAMACGTSWLMYLHRYTWSLIKPELKQEFGVDNEQLGLLDSAFSLSYSLCQTPLGILGDLAGVHLVLTGMILLWSIGLAMHAWGPTSKDALPQMLKQMWIARVVFGIGQSGVYANLSRITRTWFPSSVRTRVQGWVGTFFGRTGGASGYFLVGTLIMGTLLIPWRQAVYGLAGVGIMLGLTFLMLFRNAPSKHWAVNKAEAELIEETEDATPEAPSERPSFREVLSRMSPRSIFNVLALNIQTILSTLADNIYSAWIPTFLFDVHQMGTAERSFYATLPLLGGACGGVAGGWLNDYLIRTTGSRRWARTLVGLAGKGTAGVLLFGALFVYDDPRLFCGLLVVVKFFADWSLPSTWGTAVDIGGKASATVFAWNNSIAGIGAIIAPLVYGSMSDNFGWNWVFVTGAVAYIVCALSWLAVDASIPIVRESEEAPDGESKESSE